MPAHSIDTDRILHLSVMDMRMNTYSIRMLYVFPPLSHKDTSTDKSRDAIAGDNAICEAYDLKRLEQSFQDLLREDYPFFINGEMHVDPATGATCVRERQSQQQQEKGQPTDAHDAPQILHITPTDSTKSTHEVLATPEYSLTPHRNPRELLSIKCTSLCDGGLVIGLNVNHCVFDAEATFAFIKQWGFHFRRMTKSQRPTICHDRSLLSARGLPVQLDHPEYIIPKQSTREALTPVAPMSFSQTTMRVFRMYDSDMQTLKAFTSSGLDHLRDDASPSYISSKDALTALLTLLTTQARGHGNDVNVGIAVNGRRRLQLPLPLSYSGNAVFTAFSHFASSELAASTDNAECSPHTPHFEQQQLANMALRIRSSIQRQDNDFMRDTIEFISQHGPSHVTAATKFFFGADILFSSWTGLGSLDADFGARPLSVTNVQVPVFDGLVVFQEIATAALAKEGSSGGVDAVVYLEVDAMARLEKLWSRARQHWESSA